MGDIEAPQSFLLPYSDNTRIKDGKVELMGVSNDQLAATRHSEVIKSLIDEMVVRYEKSNPEITWEKKRIPFPESQDQKQTLLLNKIIDEWMMCFMDPEYQPLGQKKFKILNVLLKKLGLREECLVSLKLYI